MKKAGILTCCTMVAALTIAMCAAASPAWGVGTVGATTRASVDSYGAQSAGPASFVSVDPVISSDGRYTAFQSDAANLVVGDTNVWDDVFVHDRDTGATTRVSVDSAGLEGDSWSASPSISADGRYVAFRSNASNLVATDTNNCADVFVHDRNTGATTRVSVDSAGGQGDFVSGSPSISSDGRYVAFTSSSPSFVENDTNGWDDVFVHDRDTGATTRASVDSAGGQANGQSLDPSISSDGNLVAFGADATNLVGDDANGVQDVFVRDRDAGETTRVSLDTSGAEGSGLSRLPSISSDGRYVAYESAAANLVAGDTNGVQDIFVRDRTDATTLRVSVSSSGAQGSSTSRAPSISSDGRRVAFESDATNLVPGDTNGKSDGFVRVRTTGATTRVSVDSSGVQGNNYSQAFSISTDGRWVAFKSAATNLVTGDTNGLLDVFVRDLSTTPVAVDDTATVTEGATLTVDAPGVLANDADADGDPMTASLVTGVGHGTLSLEPDGSYTYRPADGFSGTDTFIYRAFDGIAYSAPATVTITVTDVAGVVTRIAGADRFAVAVRLARRGWDPSGTKGWTGVDHIIIANGDDGREADPLSAAGLAGAYDAPVLLTHAGSLPLVTRVAIAEIAAKNPGVSVHLIGGTASVPDVRWSEIRAIPGVSATRDRISGADRYAVSAGIANRIVSVKGAAAVQGVILIAADAPAAFYDALAAAPIAYAKTMPMLSVRKGSVPRSVYAVLHGAALAAKPRYAASSSTYIGTGAISSATRLTTSSNRYTAAAEIADYAIGRVWCSPTYTGLAARLPDALTGGALLGKQGGVMLFTDSSPVIRSASRTFITAHKTAISTGLVIGGTGSVPLAQEESFRALLH